MENNLKHKMSFVRINFYQSRSELIHLVQDLIRSINMRWEVIMFTVLGIIYLAVNDMLQAYCCAITPLYLPSHYTRDLIFILAAAHLHIHSLTLH